MQPRRKSGEEGYDPYDWVSDEEGGEEGEGERRATRSSKQSSQPEATTTQIEQEAPSEPEPTSSGTSATPAILSDERS